MGLVLLLLIGIPITLGLPMNKIYMISQLKPVTPLTSIYYLKVARENMQKRFVFGEEDLAYFELTIAEKRISEAEYLKAKDLSKISENQIKLAQLSNIKATKLIEKIQNKVSVEYLLVMERKNQQRLENL